MVTINQLIADGNVISDAETNLDIFVMTGNNFDRFPYALIDYMKTSWAESYLSHIVIETHNSNNLDKVFKYLKAPPYYPVSLHLKNMPVDQQAAQKIIDLMNQYPHISVALKNETLDAPGKILQEQINESGRKSFRKWSTNDQHISNSIVDYIENKDQPGYVRKTLKNRIREEVLPKDQREGVSGFFKDLFKREPSHKMNLESPKGQDFMKSRLIKDPESGKIGFDLSDFAVLDQAQTKIVAEFLKKNSTNLAVVKLKVADELALRNIGALLKSLAVSPTSGVLLDLCGHDIDNKMAKYIVDSLEKNPNLLVGNIYHQKIENAVRVAEDTKDDANIKQAKELESLSGEINIKYENNGNNLDSEHLSDIRIVSRLLQHYRERREYKKENRTGKRVLAVGLPALLATTVGLVNELNKDDSFKQVGKAIESGISKISSGSDRNSDTAHVDTSQQQTELIVPSPPAVEKDTLAAVPLPSDTTSTPKDQTPKPVEIPQKAESFVSNDDLNRSLGKNTFYQAFAKAQEEVRLAAQKDTVIKSTFKGADGEDYLSIVPEQVEALIEFNGDTVPSNFTELAARDNKQNSQDMDKLIISTVHKAGKSLGLEPDAMNEDELKLFASEFWNLLVKDNDDTILYEVIKDKLEKKLAKKTLPSIEPEPKDQTSKLLNGVGSNVFPASDNIAPQSAEDQNVIDHILDERRNDKFAIKADENANQQVTKEITLAHDDKGNVSLGARGFQEGILSAMTKELHDQNYKISYESTGNRIDSLSYDKFDSAINQVKKGRGAMIFTSHDGRVSTRAENGLYSIRTHNVDDVSEREKLLRKHVFMVVKQLQESGKRDIEIGEREASPLFVKLVLEASEKHKMPINAASLQNQEKKNPETASYIQNHNSKIVIAEAKAQKKTKKEIEDEFKVTGEILYKVETSYDTTNKLPVVVPRL